MTVVCIYRPPAAVSRQFCDKLADLLDQLLTAKQQFIICGDSTIREMTVDSLTT